MSADWVVAGRARHEYDTEGVVHQLLRRLGSAADVYFTPCELSLTTAPYWAKTDEPLTCLQCLYLSLLRFKVEP